MWGSFKRRQMWVSRYLQYPTLLESVNAETRFQSGFLWWRQGTIADLRRLILLAGDMETNPGPPTTHAVIAPEIYSAEIGLSSVSTTRNGFTDSAET